MDERAAPAAGPRPPPLWQLAGEWLRELPGLVGDRVELAALELRRSFQAVVRSLALVAAAVLLGVTAWLALWLVLIGLLVQAGLHPLVALALGSVLNVGLAAGALYRARSLLRQVGLPHTTRHLAFPRGEKTPPPPTQAPAHATPTPPEPLAR